MPLHTYNLLDEELHVTTDTRINMWFNFAPTEQFHPSQRLLEILTDLSCGCQQKVGEWKVARKMKRYVSWPLIHWIYLPKYRLSTFHLVQLWCKLPPVNWQVDVLDLKYTVM